MGRNIGRRAQVLLTLGVAASLVPLAALARQGSPDAAPERSAHAAVRLSGDRSSTPMFHLPRLAPGEQTSRCVVVTHDGPFLIDGRLSAARRPSHVAHRARAAGIRLADACVRPPTMIGQAFGEVLDAARRGDHGALEALYRDLAARHRREQLVPA